MPRLNEAQRNNAIGRLQAGEARSAVARAFNVSPSTITRLWDRYQQNGSTRDRPRTGRPRVTTTVQDRRLRQRQPQPQTLPQLALALQAEWATIPQGLIHTLIASMGRRCQLEAVLNSHGGHTRY